MVANTLLIPAVLLLIAGIGAWLDRREAQDTPLRLVLRRFWIGLALLIAFLQVWHFLFPVNGVALLLAALAGFGGWVQALVLKTASRVEKKTIWVIAGAAALLLAPAFLLGNNALFQSPHVDYGLYHLQTVKWFSQYPLVPGLGNLHHRLAFNHAIFLFGALLNAASDLGWGYYLATNVPAYALALECGAGAWALLTARETFSKASLFRALMLPAAFWHFSHVPMVGYSADNLVFILQVVGAVWLIELIERRTERASFERQARRLLVVAALGVAMKLSFAFFALLVTTAVIVVWWRAFRPATASALKTLTGWAGMMMAWVAPWMARNVIMSGYLLYPSTVIAFPLQWRMPGHLADGLTRIITLWARTDSDGIPYTGDLDWFMTWARRFPFVPRQAFLLGALVLLLAGVAFLLARARLKLDCSALSICAISLAAGIIWFRSAPDYRFSGALIFIFLVSTLMLALYLPGESVWREGRQRTAVMVLLALIFVISPNNFSNNLSRAQFLLPASESDLAQAAQPLAGMRQRTTLSGLVVHIPSEAEPAECWDYPLPCAPEPDYFNRLSLIDPADMRRGFFIPPKKE